MQSAIYEDQPHDTPEENVFSISGNDKKFILLDTDGSGDSKFFILADDQYGIYNWRKDYNGNGLSVATAKYDPSNPDSIASQMNSEAFLAKLPVEVVSHIDAQHTWITEAGNKNSDIPGDYAVNCAVSFLSYAECQQYHSKIGYDNGMLYGWFLRTARGDIDGSPYAPMYVCTDIQAGEKNASYKGRAMQTSDTASMFVRTAFWLSDDFFKTEKLDVDTLGDNVKKYIFENYSIEDLSDVGYSEKELKKLGFVSENEIMSATDADGNLITSENIGTITSVKYVVSMKDTAENVTVAAAFYDENGKLAGVKIGTENLAKGSNTKTITFDAESKCRSVCI